MSAEHQLSTSSNSSSSSSSPPRINLNGSRHNLSTYQGRVLHFFDVIDPSTLLTSDTELNRCLDLIQKYKKNDPSVAHTSTDELWHAKKISDSIIHPDTKEKITPLGRMSAFVPANIALTYGMLSASTPAANIFWQWMNQTYNVVMNYSNRSIQKGAQTDYKALAVPYLGAVGVSCSLAVGLRQVANKVARSGAPPIAKSIASIMVPYTAVASAGAANVTLMRYDETQKGIEVKNADDETVGISKAAGFEGVKQTAISRMVLSMPILIAPPILMNGIEATGLLKQYPKARTPVFLTVITGCLWCALPLAIALFPQVAEIDVSKLEPEFQHKKDKQGQPYKTLFFNKGL